MIIILLYLVYTKEKANKFQFPKEAIALTQLQMITFTAQLRDT